MCLQGSVCAVRLLIVCFKSQKQLLTAASGLDTQLNASFVPVHRVLTASEVSVICSPCIAYLFLLIDSQNAQVPEAEPISGTFRHDQHVVYTDAFDLEC